MQIKLLSPLAKVPQKDYGNAGYDLFAIENVVIKPNQRALVKTGISISIPNGYYGHISDRSGMAYKKGAHCLGKIIDPNYTGEIGVIIYNTDANNDIVIYSGDRPAQIVFKKYEEISFEIVSELTATNRGDKGYGSSGS